MSCDLVKLEDLYQSGLAAARVHFMTLVEYAISVLPPVIHGDIPKSMEDLGGLFSASTRACYITLLRDREDYFPVQAEFRYKLREMSAVGDWTLDQFTVNLGMFGPEVRATRFEDILIMSRKIARLKRDGVSEELMSHKTAESVVM